MLDARFDGAVELDAPQPQRDGTVVYSARVARTGQHQYSWGAERRDAGELRSIADQLVGIPVTADHPPGGKMLASGGQARVVGRVIDARVDGDHVFARLALEPDGAAFARAGMKEMSLGYTVRSRRGEPHAGTRVDHVALVMSGRCGASCAVRTDCAGACKCSAGKPATEILVTQLLGAF